jgi:stringent starvation protein B
MSVPLPPKKEVALALLERSSVHVHLDPRAPGVVVPAWFKKQPQLVLQIGLNMPVPIPDLRLDEEGMSCTLSFNRTPFYCVVPWSGVYAMVGDDGRGMVWPDDVPPEVATQAQGREGEGATTKRAGPRRVPGPAQPDRAAATAPAGGEPGHDPQAGGSAGTLARDEGEKLPPERARAAKELRSVEGEGTPSKAKKSRKRRGEAGASEPEAPARPNLVAVPSAQTKRAPQAVPQRAQRVAPVPAPGQGTVPGHAQGGTPATPVQTGTAASPPADGGRAVPTPRVIQAERRPRPGPRPKRELPPYLRVVK